MEERARWDERYRQGQGPTRVNPRLAYFVHLLKPGRALDLAGGLGQNAALLREWRLVLVDISEQALLRADPSLPRVQAAALALPFPPGTFDTVIDTYFFQPELELAALLTPGGTLFFETYTVADERYRPDFNPAHRLDPARLPEILRDLQLIYWQETDDGSRVFGTCLARKPES